VPTFKRPGLVTVWAQFVDEICCRPHTGPSIFCSRMQLSVPLLGFAAAMDSFFRDARYALTLGIVSLVTLAASVIPALRATRVDPVTALRGD
jgi:ABC-type antimicrobial peptide transport system permease subunit